VALQLGHLLARRGDNEGALAAYREALERFPPWARPGHSMVPAHARYVLYVGLALERLGRVREAVGHYAVAVLHAPDWWRRPLALHLIELYDAAGRLDALDRLLQGVAPERYAETIPLRRFAIVHRLEKERDWRSLVANLQSPAETHAHDRGNHRARSAAHALARHCDEAVPLLTPIDDLSQPWASYTRALCGQPSEWGQQLLKVYREDDTEMPELGFPPVKPEDLPDPIVCAEHEPPNLPPGIRIPCP
jgi:hypothetical protein